MKIHPIRVIAERTLTFASNPAQRVVVTLAVPELNAEAKDYECRYQIVGEDIDVDMYAAGLDAIQSLQLAFVAIGAHIAAIEERKGDMLQWQDGDAGFPKP